MKVAPDPELSEVVRQRLETLLAEVRPRRAEVPAAEPAIDPPPSGLRRSELRQPDLPLELPPTRAAPSGPPSTAPRRVAGDVSWRRLGSRVLEFGREHLAAVALVLLVGCAWTGYTLLQARSVPVAAAAVPEVVVTPTPSPTPMAKVLVHVLGAVKHPGLVELVIGSRVADAITAAGGLRADADPGQLNLAAVVADGDQLVIGTRANPGGEVHGAGSAGAASGGGTGGGATIDLNTATLAQLDTLPGVGPVTAQKILDWRQEHERFSSVSELQEVDGIGPKSYADIAPHVRV